MKNPTFYELLLLSTRYSFHLKIMKHVHRRCLFLIICVSVVTLVLLVYNPEHVTKLNYCVHNLNYIQQQLSFRNKVEGNFQNAFLKAQNVLNVGSNISERKSWFQISDQIFIYSAYADSCHSFTWSLSPYCVKFVGAILNNISDFDTTLPLTCAFKYDSGRINRNGYAVIKKVPEAHEHIYSAALLFCFLFEGNKWPNYVSLFEESEKDIVWLPLNVVSPNIGISPANISIAVCVRPLYGSVSSVTLSEFLSYYSIIGADHFIFYQYKLFGVAESFLKVLNFANISIEILPWNIPLVGNIHASGQLISIQECVARTRFAFSHVIVVDLDEFIVLKKHANLRQFLEEMDKRHSKAGSYVISMSLFCEEYFFKINQYPPLSILIRNRRQKSIWKPWFRSKYIAKPDRIHMAGIHYIWFHESDHKEVILSSSLALLHHYRTCYGLQQAWFFHLLSFSVLDDEIMEDNSMDKFKESITNHSVIKFLLSPLRYLV